LSFSESPQ